MKFKKFEINYRPHIGVYATVGNDFGIFPTVISKKDEKIIKEVLDIQIIKYDIGESIINGVISKIYKNKVLLSNASDKKDIKALEKEGLDVLRLDTFLAVGNLIAINDKGMLLSPEFNEDEKEAIKSFFNKPYKSFNIGESSIVGSAIAINNKNIAIHPNVTTEQFENIKELLKVEGNIATVNYGDGFVGNGLLVNDKGILIGKLTTGFEIIRLDDIFGD